MAAQIRKREAAAGRQAGPVKSLRSSLLMLLLLCLIALLVGAALGGLITA